jgi:hypothetical protein
MSLLILYLCDPSSHDIRDPSFLSDVSTSVISPSDRLTGIAGTRIETTSDLLSALTDTEPELEAFCILAVMVIVVLLLGKH